VAESDRWGGVWTEVKVKVLRDYLQTFQIALKRTSFERIYVDALAGEGTWRNRDMSFGPILGLDESERAAAETVREGSALAAIGIEPPFNRYIFNDLDHRKAEILRKRAIEHGRSSDSIEIEMADANTFIGKICATIDSQRQRGVVLLDPWGMQIGWAAVKAIAETRCLDMWYLFPTQAVVRMLPHSGIPPNAWCEKLDLCLGAADWRTEFYRTIAGSDDLFGVDRIHREASFGAVEAFVVRRLRETFGGAVLQEPLRLGPRNKPLFSFCFASANPSEKAKQLSERLARGVVRANKSTK